MNLHQWAIKWGIPVEALHDLQINIGMLGCEVPTDESESTVQLKVRLEATKKGCRLWRNNVGVMIDQDGRAVRFGLANESKAMNKLTKSSDLIGVKPVLITPGMVGTTIGQFIARETKRGNWQYSGSEHEQAQLNFINIVAGLGGDAAFATSDNTI